MSSNYSGFGSNEYEEIGNNSSANNTYNNYHSYIVVIVAMSPFICICLLCSIHCCATIFNDIMCSCYKYIKRCKRKKTNILVHNNKLTNNFINKLNSRNKSNSINEDCVICLDTVEINNKNVILNCKHIYHVMCLQDWVSNQLKQDINPCCPHCRDEIIIIIPDSPNYDNYSSHSSFEFD